MDFMKVVNEAVREIKREVNLKVLKVPEIEQKVLDATDDEPWGPHGTVLAEIAQATRKFSECQMVMNVLWTRLSETDKNWRLVYKALAVIEYLVAHGSERAVDDIIEHTFQISSLSSFEYVEPNGKDVGINVRKKAENIVGLLNNRDKIQEAREKAAANRDKYFGLSSTGITYKSGSASYGTSSMRSGDRYGGFGSSGDGDRFSDSYRDNDRYGGKSIEREYSGKSSRGVKDENQASKVKVSARGSKDRGEMSSSASKSSSNVNDPAKYSSMSSQSSDVPSNKYDDDFDDFDPRGTSTSKPASGSSKQVDLFGDSLIGDLLDAPASVPIETPAVNSGSSDVDLFADADFVSAPSQADKGATSQTKTSVDLFASQPGIPSATSPAVDLFATSNDPVVQPDNKAPKEEPTNTDVIDPFGAIPLNSFDGSNAFGSFTSEHPVPMESTQNSGNDASVNKLNGKSLTESKPSPKKENFQVKSGIWADSLSRGLIDLNITAPKKVSLTDVGIVGGLSDGSDEREKGPPASYNMGMSMGMGRAMGAGSGLGRSDFGSSQTSGGDDIFSNFSSQQYQYGGFKK